MRSAIAHLARVTTRKVTAWLVPVAAFLLGGGGAMALGERAEGSTIDT